jgi:PIN domain nuclease of toxin-antitoxin system
VILLDTHIWVWWVQRDTHLPARCRDLIEANIPTGVGVSVISCWEVAMLVEYGRLRLAKPVAAWISEALAYPGVQLTELTPDIAIASTQLPPTFHRDPADRWLVATARLRQMDFVTLDSRILNYPHVPLAQF